MSARPQRRPAAPLSLDAIVTAATRITEEDGFGAISMRRIADDLGVSPMALYKHVANKHDLLDLIANECLADLDTAADIDAWQDRLKRIFRSFHELMAAHP